MKCIKNLNKVFFFPQFGILPNLNYQLQVHSVDGVLDEKRSLNFNSKSFSTLIQHDKSKYKPKDLVQFRVILVNPNTKCLKVHKALNVKILDPNGNTLQKWTEVSAPKGVFKASFTVPKQPTFGSHQISVEYRDQVNLLS
jgi:CD109 antigen